ncbi:MULTISPECIES: ABC transporter ATP-binding protein [Archaeoglobus]|uniref:ABC transporter, ATP-binding protein n=2 Tax=Archaeoglobus fulgidus TaxID=2234 RepID=O28969_ARCFU|nr:MULTISPECIES: ABC transporter ATP-binding protein [Archaeoglobus]AAB89946.1 ABC transporter, ATP-binding protein [Archaeoglobus fulgidus DSM 4304]AIG98181.1 ABC-type multidrug transport system, ATPase component [Archaeoglobus fulgidus DSM 8774]MDI3498092.1 type transport system ATP-binding protein [Archaeoglobus sp.]
MRAVECRDVWMVYRTFMERGIVALRGIDLDIEDGVIFGLLGPNGAGKTTLISILSTILIPTKGEVRILGMDAFKNTRKVRERINISSGVRMPWGMKVYECLRFYAMCYGITDRRVVDRVISEFELEEHRNKRFDDLSTGNKQKANLARAFLNDPEVVFLDEPTANLDPDMAKKIRQMILRIKEEKDVTIVLTTHNMREAEMLCDRIAFIKEGKIVAEGTSEELKKYTKMSERVILKLKGNAKKLHIPYPYRMDGNTLIAFVEDAEKALPSIVVRLAEQGVFVESAKMEEITLEDVFIELAEGS